MSMRAAVLALFMCASFGAFIAAQQPPLPPRDVSRQQVTTGSGVIAGVVRATDTGMPIRGVDIRLAGLPRGARGAFTDADGRYEFSGLPDGQYTLIASKVRYMTMTYGQTRAGEEGRRVEVAGGRRVENIDFVLPLGAVIVLRVGNRFGEPAVGYRVTLYQTKFNGGQRSLAAINESGFSNVTDDRGEIRLSGLAPGEYYAGAELNLPPTEAGEREVLTYYPGTPVEAEAQPIAVGLGEEVVFGFDTMLSRTFRIAGTVAGTAPPDRVQLERVAPGGMTIVSISIGSGASFSHAPLSPGEYVVTARNDKELGTLRVQVTGSDLNGLVVPMRPAVPIRGRVTFEGTAPQGLAPTSFVLRPALVSNGIAAVAQYQKQDWTFEIPALLGPGVIRGELPRGWFLKAVMLDGRDVVDTVLDFATYLGKTVEVVVTQTATEVSGRVTDASGRDVTNYVAVAFAEDPQRWTLLTRAIQSVRPDQQGRFSIRGLPPGRYLVAAVAFLQSGRERDPTILERLRTGATPVTLTEGASRTVTARLVTQ